MQNNFKFSEFLKETYSEFDKYGSNSALISICQELPNLELIDIYEKFLNEYSFSAFWEENNSISYIAFDKCKYINLDGPNRFQLAKNFNQENFKKLINLSTENHESSLAKILYFFSFSEESHENSEVEVDAMEAVLPKILIIKDSQRVWLRMNSQVTDKSRLRDIIEEFWDFRHQILNRQETINKTFFKKQNIQDFYFQFEKSYAKIRKRILNGIKIIKDGKVDKIVLAARINLEIKEELDLINILRSFRDKQPNTCRYVWKRHKKDITFGASPEKLFSYNNKVLCLEAIAGTCSRKNDSNLLLKSRKNIKEHNFVIEYLLDCLKILKIYKYRSTKLKVIEFGDIAHLHTQVSCEINKICPFKLLEILHPSPAVCGFPKEPATKWIDTLENFPRNNYASPIGSVDSNGNAHFIVAIRGVRNIGNRLEFTAGAGLINDSDCETEVEEIKIKFEVLAYPILRSKINQ